MTGAKSPCNGRLRITYIGHATLLLEFDDVRILTDPNFDAKLGRFLPRVTPPGMEIAELPCIDAILLTHAHADHLSFPSLRALPSDIPIYAPPVITRWLHREGIANACAILSGQTIHVRTIAIEAATARHVGARYGIDQWRGVAHMYLLDDGTSSVLFSGDTGITPVASALARRILPRQVDVALLPIGDAPWWKRSLFRRGHLTSEDALLLFDQINARIFVPFHWGTFRHVTSGAYDAIDALRILLAKYWRATDVRILNPGESLLLDTNPQ